MTLTRSVIIQALIEDCYESVRQNGPEALDSLLSNYFGAMLDSELRRLYDDAFVNERQDNEY